MYQKIVRSLFGFLLAVGFGMVLSSCGGGGGSGAAAPQPVLVTGTAATGAPFVGNVTLISANGTTKTVAIGGGGAYSIDVTGLNGPFLLQTGAGNQSMLSWAPTAGVANLTQLSTLAIELAVTSNVLDLTIDWATKHTTITEAGINNALAVINANLKDQLTAAGLSPQTYNFLRAAFVADGTGIDHVLDGVHIAFDFATGNFTLKDTQGSTIPFDPNGAGGNGGGTAGPVSVTVSNASPSNGNGSLTALQIFVSDGTGPLEGPPKTITLVGVTATVNGEAAPLNIYFRTATGEVTKVAFGWGTTTDLRFAQCGIPDACSGASVDLSTNIITLSNTAVTNASGLPAATATLNGTIKFTPLPSN